ncbi:MAG: 4-hydroxy-tetrahydrodipicolinate synthase [Candidatus Pacebacteria bacterium]|nr:4-hydroxy-tetrahydrodipicolinate synthase [Candidatus Paceibacterota bacterium]
MWSVKGCGTALVTAFQNDGSIDEKAMREIVERQISEGIDFLVPCGTTGESPTLSHAEHIRVIEIVVEQSAGRVPVIAGTGSNSTQEAIDLTRNAKKVGAQGCLVVAPYYNKPTKAGLLDYFTQVANVGLPVVVYNIPGRTGVNISPETMLEIALHPNIVGIKEATGSLEQTIQDIALCGNRLKYFSGDDTLTLPMMSVGACGVISVVSNIMPRETTDMVHAALVGEWKWKHAREKFLRLFPICKAMFIETNPIPVKTAMAVLGHLEPVWRSPMVAPTESTFRAVVAEMEKVGLPIPEAPKVASFLYK